jgi:hypothetical protein
MTDDYVVTYRIDHADGFSIYEFYRGDEVECRRIALQSTPPTRDDDGNKVTAFKVIVGPAVEWDKFLDEGWV